MAGAGSGETDFRGRRGHHNQSCESGQAMVFFALLLAALLGILAIAIDLGNVYVLRRQLQSAADLAALAGAQRVYGGTTADMSSEALSYASRNGFPSATVNVPPASGPHEDEDEYVEVLIDRTTPTFFAGILGINSVLVSARAVARGGGHPAPYALIGLSGTASPAIGFNGAGLVWVQGAGMMSNSAADPSIKETSSSGNVRSDGPANAVGPIVANGNFSAPSIRSGVPYYPDPLQNMSAPYFDRWSPVTRGGDWDRPQNNIHIPASGGDLPFSVYNCQAQNSTTFCPGIYWGGIQIEGGSYTMAPGIYIIAGGGFAVTGGSISGQGVFIYNTNDPYKPNGQGDYGAIRFNTNQGVRLEASHDALYSGMAENVLIFQDRLATGSQAAMSIQAVGNTDLAGAIYVPSNLITIAGGGAMGVNHGQIIADRIAFTGSSASGVQYDSDWAAAAPGSSLVE